MMAHEDLKREQHVDGSSDRSFGFVLAVVFVVIAGWPLFYGAMPRWWAFGPALLFALVALLKPGVLSGLNKWWIKFGVLLGKIVSPIALGIVFYGVVTPIGVLMRLVGKDPLRQKINRGAESYWIAREPPGPPPDSMTHQF